MGEWVPPWDFYFKEQSRSNVWSNAFSFLDKIKMDDVNKEKHISYEKERYCRKQLLYLLRYGAAKEGLPVSKRGKIIFLDPCKYLCQI